MQRPSDEELVAYLDGELDGGPCDRVARALEADPSLRDRANALTKSAARLRAAMDEVLREDVPQHLLDAAHGKNSARVVDRVAVRARRVRKATLPRRWDDRRWWLGGAIAASLVCLLIGAGGGYFIGIEPDENPPPGHTADNHSHWLDNIAGYHRLLINAGANERGLVDVQPSGSKGRPTTQKLPAGFHLPNLKRWGLAYQGARYLVVEGRPATQLFYTSNDKKLGSVTIVVGVSSKPDLHPAAAHRDGINFIYWRHKGHAYALVGTADVGYLWNIAKDIAFQFNAAL